MAASMGISNAAAIAACNAVVDLLDGGSLVIYDGSRPASVDTAVSTQNALATLTLSSPAFGSAADVNPGAQATANAITSDSSADATGTATWFRAFDSEGDPVIDGNVGTSDADLILDSVDITAGQEVKINSWTVTMPES